MNNYLLKADSLKKNFARRLIFDNLNFDLGSSVVFGIAGANGSGKSTLIKIIAGMISPSSGKIRLFCNDEEVIPEKLHNHIGLVSPYLVLYDEFTSWENLSFFSQIRGIPLDTERASSLLRAFRIYERRSDLVKTYSSGMKQRLKFVFALLHSPGLLLLDEPTSNLDDEGKEAVYKLIREEGERSIVVVASNEKSDLSLCEKTIVLG